MKRSWFQGRRRFVLALVLALAPALSLALAQTPGGFNERDTKQRGNVPDREDLWVLDFKFKDPRLITVDIPGRGRKLCWYLWYQVTNYSKEPRTFIPDFELVTLDKPGVYHDQVLPKVQKAIQEIEDPTGHLDIKNSVTISLLPIPVSKPKDVANPRSVSGVAIWDNVNPDSNRYSIFVAGLSNGWSEDDRNLVRRKTLQLNFKRLGDRFFQDSREIRFVPPEEWVYRASTIKAPEAAKEPAPKEPAKEPKEPAPKNEKEKTER